MNILKKRAYYWVNSQGDEGCISPQDDEMTKM